MNTLAGVITLLLVQWALLYFFLKHLALFGSCRLTHRTSSEKRQRVSVFSPPLLSSARQSARKCRLARRINSKEMQHVSVSGLPHLSSVRFFERKFRRAARSV